MTAVGLLTFVPFAFGGARARPQMSTFLGLCSRATTDSSEFEDTATASSVLDTLQKASDPIPCKFCNHWISGLPYLREHQTSFHGRNCKGSTQAQSGLAKCSPWIPRSMILFREVFRRLILYKHIVHQLYLEFLSIVPTTSNFGSTSALFEFVLPFLMHPVLLRDLLQQVVNYKKPGVSLSCLMDKYRWLRGH